MSANLEAKKLIVEEIKQKISNAKSIAFVGREDRDVVINDGRLEKLHLIRDNANFRNGYMYSFRVSSSIVTL